MDNGFNGVIPVYKEAGWTSFDVCAKLRGLLRIKKVGHAGTLDPDATGVLVVCIGQATKKSQEFMQSKKIYETVMLLGKTTDTQDISGTVISESQDFPDADRVREVIENFPREYDQIPPMYSAKKKNGKKLYELAREGKEIERDPVRVQLFGLGILDINIPRVKMEVSCSPGTYIRTLCKDIGESLGCGACMESLVRTYAGGFNLSECKTIGEISQMIEDKDFSFIHDTY